METSKLGKRGTVVIPASIRRRYGFKEGGLVITEERDDGVLLRPAVAVAVEMYSPARRAEFILSNAVDEEDYQQALKEVRRMGLKPEKIPHHKPRR